MHKNAILGRVNQWLIKDILGQQNIHPDEPSKKFVGLVGTKKWLKTTFILISSRFLEFLDDLEAPKNNW